MKQKIKQSLILILFLILALGNLNSQIIQPLEKQYKGRILFAHPTAYNIEILRNLNKKRLLHLDSIEMVGVYYKYEKYDYKKSRKLIKNIPELSFKLIELSDTLTDNNIYSKNELTDEFSLLFKNSNGILFFGGPDIPAKLYKEPQNPLTKVTDPYRHYYELSFLFHLLGGKQNKNYTPLLKQNPNYFIHGICLGMQSINVATGGTLIQDIASVVYNSSEKKGLKHLDKNRIHRNYYKKMLDNAPEMMSGYSVHQIKLNNNFLNLLNCKSKKLTPSVFSYHHQAIKNIGKGLTVAATSMDGKIQFHPEQKEIYYPKNKVFFEPEQKSKYMPEWLNENSLKFHEKYWKSIDEIIQKVCKKEEKIK